MVKKLFAQYDILHRNMVYNPSFWGSDNRDIDKLYNDMEELKQELNNTSDQMNTVDEEVQGLKFGQYYENDLDKLNYLKKHNQSLG